ncbi:hypothetical protein JVT61DRAFT_12045 [Boletus reticuloceps]|uniref:Uncharacterized protein n=1 Tax=Boletus reticuloceps TaxID=495285 RepID=A0A8I3A5A4_9AGAM|nr:hypothetical protein JVT61DRAFT_12045 [Boletus reticuloceps]
MTLQDLQCILAQGNHHSCPGPNGWEKWQLKELLDTVLQLALHLVNFSTVSSHFSSSIKSSTLFTIEWVNYQGICCSNLHTNLDIFTLSFYTLVLLLFAFP